MNEALPDVPEVRVVGLPQLTSGFDLVERLDLPMHLKVHGPLEPMGGEQLAGLAEAISLKGRGGAGFPFAKKLRSVAESAIKKGVRPVVVVNGSEDEPACRKDTVLINRAPHLILDGALLAAEAMGARTLVIGVTRESTQRSMEAALAERGLSNRRGSPLRARVQRNPVRMVTGAAASLIRSIDGGPAIPPGRKISASQTGVGGAPTLLSNAETFAQLAIAARIGPDRYRNTGLYDEPGTVMLTVSGAVARPMVIEVPTGVPLRYVLQLAGAPPMPQGVLTGGYHGKWLDAATVNEAIVSRNSLDAVGGALGAGAILPISPADLPARRVAAGGAVAGRGERGTVRSLLPRPARRGARPGGHPQRRRPGRPGGREAGRQGREAARRVLAPGRLRDVHRVDASRRSPTTWPRMSSATAAEGPWRAFCRSSRAASTPTGIPGGQAQLEAGPSRQKIYVDWTLCRGHGLCADILPEVFELGADGFPTVAQASVPRYAEAKALRAVRRCPALALRLEEDTRSSAPARNNLPRALPGGRGPPGARQRPLNTNEGGPP